MFIFAVIFYAFDFVAKNKLKRFADMTAYSNVIATKFDEVFRADFRLKGRWTEEIFGNGNPLTLELGCGKGEYTVALARKYPEKNGFSKFQVEKPYLCSFFIH